MSRQILFNRKILDLNFVRVFNYVYMLTTLFKINHFYLPGIIRILNKHSDLVVFRLENERLFRWRNTYFVYKEYKQVAAILLHTFIFQRRLLSLYVFIIDARVVITWNIMQRITLRFNLRLCLTKVLFRFESERIAVRQMWTVFSLL